jgi:MoxR-like ATPase
LSRVIPFGLPQRALPDSPDEASISRFALDAEKLASNIHRVVVARERTVRLMLTGLFSEGHILLEDLPGVGKTLLARTLANSIEGKFRRVQFTPDLLPSDITGTTVFEVHSSKFRFVEGPIFANVVLADEINRTGPRTQAALLEAMAESHVTVDGEELPLPRPFIVIATQNLSESHGTFPLPDSQRDRFLISLGIGLPSPEQESEILRRAQHGASAVSAVMTTARVLEMQDLVKLVEVTDPVRQYLVNILGETRRHPDAAYGVSPRGGAALQRAAQCHALFEARPFVAPEDVREMARHVLPHRLLLRPDASVTAGDVIEAALDTTPVPA